MREQPVTCELQGFPTNTRSRAGKSDVDDPLRRPIVGFTQNVWSEQWTSRGRILSGLADRKWPTLYSSGARTIWDLRNGALGTSAWRHTIRNDGNLRVDIPGRLLLRWPTVPLFDRIALATHGRHLRRGATGWSRCPSIALLFHPAFYPYVDHIEPRLLVYYACDAYRLMPGWTDELERHESDLLDRADLVLAYSQGMLDLMPGDTARRGVVLPTGVDIESFSKVALAPAPPDLQRIPHPRLGYVGRINQKLDFALILQMAEQRPNWHWVFVGNVGAEPNGRFAADAEAETLWSRCRALPNVHVLGNKPHDDVPLYLTNMDVNLMCYRTHGTGWWSEIFPLKSMEYLAAGKPVVCAPVKSMLGYSDNIAIASTVREWIDAIEHALSSGGRGTPLSRRAVALANTWDHRIDLLQHLLLQALQATSR